MSRPPIYGGEILKQATDYVEEIAVPTAAGLAVHLGVARQTIYQWRDDHKEFSDILGRLLAKQEANLISGGLAGDYNPTIAKLILTKHGYSDRQEISGNEGGPIQVDNQWSVEFVNPEVFEEGE